MTLGNYHVSPGGRSSLGGNAQLVDWLISAGGGSNGDSGNQKPAPLGSSLGPITTRMGGLEAKYCHN